MITPMLLQRHIMPSFRANQAVKFGSMTGMALDVLGDFTKLGTTAVKHNQFIYAAVILSRILFARSPNERWENARRDALGWFFWFMGNAIVKNVLTKVVATAKPELGEFLISNKDLNTQGPLKKAVSFLFAPDKFMGLNGDKQIEEIGQSLIKTATSPQEIETITKLVRHSKNVVGLIALFGLIASILLLGVVINLINIAMTKADLGKRIHQSNQQDAIQPEQGMQPGINPEMALPNANPVNPMAQYLQPTPQQSMPGYNYYGYMNPMGQQAVNPWQQQTSNPWAAYQAPQSAWGQYASPSYSGYYNYPGYNQGY